MAVAAMPTVRSSNSREGKQKKSMLPFQKALLPSEGLSVGLMPLHLKGTSHGHSHSQWMLRLLQPYLHLPRQHQQLPPHPPPLHLHPLCWTRLPVKTPVF
jgi:hypothetical protein